MDADQRGASLRLVPHLCAGAMTIYADGELDLSTGPALERLIKASLRVPDLHMVVIDCARLRFLDAAGLGVLVRCYRQLQDDGRSLTVRETHGEVAEALIATGVGEILGMALRVPTWWTRKAQLSAP
ncbi:MAG: STAS domain-containing protein [Micromonosporaceae bacterium]